MTLRLGVPNKGRLNERTIELLVKSGIDLGEDIGRRLYLKAKNQDIEVIFVRAQDVPVFIAEGAIDMGITGIDETAESGRDLIKILDLQFGYCHLAVAVPEASGITDASQIADGSRIATSFPNLTRKYFEDMGKNVQIITVTGACEIMPYMGVSDYITDLVSTGSTLKTNRLREVGNIIESQAVVITSKAAMEKNGQAIQDVVDSFQSVIIAEDKKYLMADIPKDKLEVVEKIIPGIGGPTVLEIAGNSDYLAVHAVIDGKDVFKTINELKRIGAKGILTTPIERLVN
ncbi:MAG: ATP phosphoribosyltransferase [Candidatus Methanomethylophilaceae archaeon]|nr:ATP phosphoribosyltransferase [Candidatus Methanomethylophilaceae archaeon]MBP5685773.1 ATP phosphoribosyltransferase [Candidatus Methanomethylophilaceae archaeon]MBP5734857.1 ATP phosphoribosyltransferase [Candidatus Methanomethylophilaceae archaeon]